MIEFPFCKINLGLHVLKKRTDGYHDIETCFYPVPWKDILEIIPSDKQRLDITGLGIPGDPRNNLVHKAYEILKKDFDLKPVHIHLHKIIPHGAGLGGGSSDGAHAIKLLNQIFTLNLSVDYLKFYASQLGSDCSYFIENSPMIAKGRGEILKPISLDLSGFVLVIVKPPLSVSSAEAYSGVTPVTSDIGLRSTLNEPITKWQALLKNDFEESVFLRYPAISVIKNKLYKRGAVYASMSGSGSSVFGLFENKISIDDLPVDSIVWQVKL